MPETRYFATITAQLRDAHSNTCSVIVPAAIHRFISAPRYRRGAPIVDRRSRNDYYSVLSAVERINPVSHACTRASVRQAVSIIAHLLDHSAISADQLPAAAPGKVASQQVVRQLDHQSSRLVEASIRLDHVRITAAGSRIDFDDQM